jgi:hypothetical protein
MDTKKVETFFVRPVGYGLIVASGWRGAGRNAASVLIRKINATLLVERLEVNCCSTPKNIYPEDGK